MNIFIKTCPRDFLRLNKLIDSLNKYNKDDIPTFVCIEKRYEDLLYDNVNVSNVKVIFSDDILKDYDILKLRKNLNRWQIQQVIKFEYTHQSQENNHLIVDSDSIFIKPFYKKDFVDSDNNLYTVMSKLEDRIVEIASDSINADINFEEAKMLMKKDREAVQKKFKREGDILEFGPPPVLWSTTVVNNFYENFLLKNKKTFADIISEIPIEYNWYGEWLLETKCIPLKPIEPLFKNISNENQYQGLMEKKITKNDLKNSYIGINIQTNWAIDWGVLDYEL
mgnify:CR=1 FL=1|tara:strand:+ start:1999 stop:2838 length:840 start_codon:yes stop_codon:yes gene_type:complete